MRLQGKDYSLMVHNILDSMLVPLYRVQDVSINTDFRTEVTLQLSDEGMVEQKKDVPVVVTSFMIHQIAKEPDSNRNAMSYLAALAGEFSQGQYREDCFSIGRTLTHYPDGVIDTSVDDFDNMPPGFTTRADMWLAIKDRSDLNRIICVPNSFLTSVAWSFSVDGLSEVSLVNESDERILYQDSLIGVDIDYRIAGVADETNNSITVNAYTSVQKVFIDCQEVNFDASSSPTIDFANQGNDIQNGDLVKYIYLPSTPRTWSNYELTSVVGDQGGINKGELDIYMLTDTSADRISYGFYSARGNASLSNIVSDGSNDVVIINAGTAMINGSGYYAGFTTSTATGGGTSTLVDTSKTEPDDFWNGCVITMTSGNAAGEDNRVSDFDQGTNTFTFESAFSAAIANTDTYRIEAQAVTGTAGDTAIYVVAGTATLDAAATAPANSVKIADITMSGSDIATYANNRTMGRTKLDLIQEATIAAELGRSDVAELGNKRLVDKKLDKPVIVTVDVTANDSDGELTELFSGLTGEIEAVDAKKVLGVQVNLYENNNRLEKDKRVVFEVHDATISTEGIAAAVRDGGTFDFSMIADNIRIFVVH